MSERFEWSRVVEFYETDAAGIAHFSNFYRWMEAAEHAFLRERGVILHGEKFGLGLPRVQAEAEFKKPVRYGQQIRVTVVLEQLRTRSLCYRFEFRTDESEELHATGTLTAVVVDLKTMKAMEIPAAVREKLTGENKSQVKRE